MIPDTAEAIRHLTGDELENARAATHESAHVLISEYLEMPRASSVRISNGGGVASFPFDDGRIRPAQEIAIFLAGPLSESWLRLPPRLLIDEGRTYHGDADIQQANKISYQWDYPHVNGKTWQEGYALVKQALRNEMGAAIVPFAKLLDRRGYLAGADLDRAIHYAMEVGRDSMRTPAERRLRQAREERSLALVPKKLELYDEMVKRGVGLAMTERQAWKEAGRMAAEYIDNGKEPSLPARYEIGPPRPLRVPSSIVNAGERAQ